MWNWQQADWPNFYYKLPAIEQYMASFYQLLGELKGAVAYQDQHISIDMMLDEALQTSKIEGDHLDRHSLRSSIRQAMGLSANSRLVKPQERGIVELMVQAVERYDQPITETLLCDWNLLLTNHRFDLLEVGRYRRHEESMEIVSGAIGRAKVHYQALPSERVASEMQVFLAWLQQPGELPLLIYLGIAHVYFLAIHPFEDGNGRIARALTLKLLSQQLGRPVLFLLSHTIENNKKSYYEALQTTNQSLDLSAWLEYFCQTLLQALQNTRDFIDFKAEQAKRLQEYEQILNDRQLKTIKRLFAAGLDGFEGGLSAKNYMTITQCAASTATRDLADLVSRGILRREGELRGARYYLG